MMRFVNINSHHYFIINRDTLMLQSIASFEKNKTVLVMKNIVLTLVLSCGCVSVSFSNTSLDSLYRKAYYTDSVKSIIALVPDFKEQCSGNDLAYMYKLYFLIGNKARFQHQPSLAFSYYHKAFELAKRLEDYNKQRSTMAGISMLYFSINDFVNAKQYKRKAIEFAQEAGQTNRVASYFTDLGSSCRRQGQIDSAVYYLQKSYEIEKDLGNKKGQSMALNGLGLCAYAIEDYDQAVDYYYRALNLNDTSNHIKYMVYTNHGLIEVKRGNLTKAKKLLNQAITAKRSLDKNETTFIPQYNLMGEIYMKSQQYDSALAVFTKALFLNDYKGLNGANTEELNITTRALHKLDSVMGKKYLLADLGVYDKYSEFIMWFTSNQDKLRTLNAKISLQMQEDKITHQHQTEIFEKKIFWLVISVIICSFGVWTIMLLLKFRKRRLVLQKIAAFDDNFEKRFNNPSLN